PNPFNPSTVISFSVPKEAFVTLKVYDITGTLVKTLVSENKVIGFYNVTFDASSLVSGVYFYRLEAGDVAISKKMMLLK
ncbi:MAG: peptidase S8, partial [Ignavibacteriales bacterium UTCHB3]